MELKKLLENKPKLKENLAMYILKTGIFNDLLKTNRNSAQQIVLMKLEEKIFSMNETEIIEYFDTTNLISQIAPNIGKLCSFRVYIWKDGIEIYVTPNGFKTRKEACIHCAQKLIELSN